LNFQDTGDLKAVFREIRDYFAGNVTGITRDEKIAQIIIRLLFCKIWDETLNDSGKLFRVDASESHDVLEARIQDVFVRVKSAFPHLFLEDHSLGLRGNDLHFVVEKLEPYTVSGMERDVIGDAFEEFIGTAFRGGEGQFFTPRNVVEMMVRVLNPSSGERVIDPACGSGGFLAFAIRHQASQGVTNGDIVGVDKDSFLADVARTYTSLLSNSEGKVFCENSLSPIDDWASESQSEVKLGTFDVVITNPPFGVKIPVVGKKTLDQYKLAGKRRPDGGIVRLDKQSPQILFIERCVELLKPGGRMGIVLPEGVFGNASDKYVWEYLEEHGSIFGVVSLAQEAFQPSTHTKTSVLFFEKSFGRKSLFMGIASRIGHNKNGKVTHKLDSGGNVVVDKDGAPFVDDDIPEITRKFNSYLDGRQEKDDELGFVLSSDEVKDHIYIPEYYNPNVISDVKSLQSSRSHTPLTIGEMCDKGWLSISRGREIGSHFYGTGEVPFIRTSDIVNWELKIDPIKGVSEEAYQIFADSMDVKPGDILFVSDGTFLIGRTAIITPNESKILIQSHIKKIRVNPSCPFDYYYLMFLLNTSIVQDQIIAKTFIQATISTIGDRLMELVLPISKDKAEIESRSKKVKSIITGKSKIRDLTRSVLESRY
jgi:type I restriction enzyme M protein